MAIDAPIHSSEGNLPRVLGAGLPLLLAFWRRGCAHCDQVAPVLERLAKSYAGHALVVKINADEEPGLLARYNISQLPSTVFVRDGKPLGTAVGAVGEMDLSGWLSYLVKGGSQQPPVPRGPAEPVRVAAAAGARPAPQRQPEPAPARTAAGQPHAEGAQAPGEPVILTDANIGRLLSSTNLPVLVDCWAPWCGPCKMIAPAVAALAKEFQGRAIVGKLNVDENPQTSAQHDIMAIPTLLIFRNGQIVDQDPGRRARTVSARTARAAGDRLTRVLARVVTRVLTRVLGRVG